MRQHVQSAPEQQRDRPPLSRDRILDAAVRLVDEHGLDALSMRRLGKELGVEAMSIYNHVPNKSALLDGIVDKVISELDLPEPGQHWTDKVCDMARSFRIAGRRHPNVVPLIAMRRFNTNFALVQIEIAFSILEEAGFEGDEVVHAFRTLAGFATGYTLAETGGFFGEGFGASDYELDPSDLSEDDFPYLVRHLPHIAHTDHDDEFDFALDVLIAGLKHKLESEKGPA